MTFKNRMGLAVAAAMVLGCGAANAATISVTPVKYSAQGLKGATSATTINLPVMTLTLGADYAVNDTLTLQFTGVTPKGTPADFDCSGGNSPPDAVVSFVNQPDAQTFNYRVTVKNILDTTGLVCTIGAVTPFAVAGNSAAAVPAGTNMVLSYTARATVPNLPLDQGTQSQNVLQVLDQFTATVTTAFDGVVDVNQNRKVFTSGATDVLTITTANIGGTLTGFPAVLGTTAIVVSGDFSFTDTDLDGCGDDALAGHLDTGLGTVTVAANCTSATVALGAGVVGAVTLTVTGADSAAFGVLTAPQSFSETTTMNYTSAFAVTSADVEGPASAGAWTLNGFSAFVPYMPFGDTISQIIYLTNKSTQSGSVTVDGYNSAGTACSFAAGTAAKKAVTQLSDAIVAGFKACYGATYTGKVSFNVTANIPGGLAEVYSAYNVNGNRLTVINNSNGKSGGTYGGGKYTATLGGNL